MNSCFTCKHRSKDLKNNWDQAPAYQCANPESFRHKRMVLKGMICSEHEPKKSWKEKAA